MTQSNKNPLTRVERPKRNYAMISAAAILLALLVAGIGLAARDDNWPLVGVFVAGILLFLVVLLLDVAEKRRLAAIDDRKFIHWDAAMPEIQRQNVNLEVRELAKVLGVGREQLTDLLSAYVVAEDLALRQIQQEENLPLMRHVSIGKMPFDGILVDQDLITCIEVAFLVTPDLRQEKVEAMLRKITQAKKNLGDVKSRLRIRLMLVLVTQLSEGDEDQLRSMLTTRRFTDTPVDIDIRLLDFEMLQKVYVSE